jgi:hypothetical protein
VVFLILASNKSDPFQTSHGNLTKNLLFKDRGGQPKLACEQHYEKFAKNIDFLSVFITKNLQSIKKSLNFDPNLGSRNLFLDCPCSRGFKNDGQLELEFLNYLSRVLNKKFEI